MLYADAIALMIMFYALYLECIRMLLKSMRIKIINLLTYKVNLAYANVYAVTLM